VEENDLSEVTQFHARFVSAASKAAMNASITDIAHGATSLFDLDFR